MNLFELSAKITADTSGFDKALGQSKKSMSEYRSDVMALAQTYKKQGMDMSSTMKKAYAEIDKGQYESAENSEKDSKTFFKNWENASGKVIKVAGKLGNCLATMATVGAAAITAASTAVTALTTKAVKSYAEYEQLVGGVQTLFGLQGQSLEEYANAVGKTTDAALDDWLKYTTGERKILNNAENAYKSAGMSMNQYMETVTSFSASLIASLDGDTAKAADYADMAIIDMADNANKMGTSIESIQNAYQGFAKQNYTMLDNLKLGYGGTKSEMERLLKDAQKISGIKYDISSFADVTEAIHVMQTEMGIAGATAEEAASTIEGSIGMMKSAWENLVVGMADENADMDTLMNNFVESVATAAENLLPRIEQTLAGIGTLIEELSPVIAEALPVLVETLLPTLISSGASLISSLVKGIVEALPELGKALLDAVTIILTDVFGVSEENAQKFSDGVTGAFTSIKSGFSKMVESAQTDGTTLNKVWTGIKEGFETVKKFFKEAFEDVSDFFKQCVEDINTEGTWLNETWTGIQEAVQAFFDYISALFTSISEAFTWCVEQISTEGTILNAIWETIKTYASTAWENIKIIISTAIDVITGIFQYGTAILQGDWSAAWDAIKGIAVSVWEGITSAVSNAAEGLNTIISDVWESIKTTASEDWEGVKSTISGVWEGITSSISDAIEGVETTLSGVWESIKTTASETWESIKSAITDPIEDAWETVSGVIEDLVSAFDFDWSLPDLKLPHISVQGGEAPYGIGGKGKLPSFSIEWYKKAYDNAMVLSKPTIFGYSNGNFLGGGDGNGNEIVAGESHLMNMIGQTVESRTTVQNERVVSILIAILDAITDGNEDTIRAILADKTFSVGEREFARLVKTYA